MDGQVDPYASHSRFTHPGPFEQSLAAVAGSLEDISRFVQGLLLNIFESHLYGLEAREEDWPNCDIEAAAVLVEKILAVDPRPLSTPRPPERRLVACCRQFVLLACAILRTREVPARNRGGFASYLPPGRWVGHGLCEARPDPTGPWVRFDPQIDDVQTKAHEIRFDALDLGPEHFLCGAEAWLAYRDGALDPGEVDGGVNNLRNVVLLDLLEMNKLETHKHRPALMPDPAQPPTPAQIQKLDRLAAETLRAQGSFESVRALYLSDPDVHIPIDPDDG